VAAAAFDEAIALQGSLSAQFPGVPGYRRDLATTLNNRGTLRHSQGQIGALADFRRARELFAGLTQEHPLASVPRSGFRTPSVAEEAAASYQEELARTHLRLAALRTGRDAAAAGRAVRKALGLWQGLVERFPGVPHYQHERAATLLVRGTLHHLAGRSGEAERDYREAEAALSRLTAQFGSVPDYRVVLANVCRNLGQLLRQGNHPRQAEKVWRAAVTELAILAATFPNEPSYRQQLGSAHNEVGIALAMQNKARQAVAAWREALTVQAPLVSQRPADATCWQDLIDTHTNLTAMLAGLSSSEALPSARALLAAQRRRLQAFPKETAYRDDLARACQTLGELLLHRGDHAEAAALLAELDRVAPCRRDVPGRVPPERAAELLAGCVAAADRDATLPESRRRQLTREYGDRAMALLNRAADQGYRDHRALADAPFTPLHPRADFQGLLRRLRGPK
jgi:tetratricopeptide (TPR) repeat protein